MDKSKETRSFIRMLNSLQSLSYELKQFFLFLAIIFTIVYMNRTLFKPATAGWQATLKRIKSAAVICGILFVASSIMLFLTNYAFLNGISDLQIGGIIAISRNLLNTVRILSGSLAIVFTVKYWIGKKSQINQ